MKNCLVLITLLSASTLLPAQDKAALREISAVYAQIEENHQSWNHYATTIQHADPGHSVVNQLWVSTDEGDAKLSKLETTSSEDHGETKLQFFFKGDRLLFTLDRTETFLIDPNVTDVDEKRYYFANEKLVRVLNKKGRFPAGKPADTGSIKGTEVPLSEIDNADETYRDQHEMTAPLIQKLLNLDEDAVPTEDPLPASTSDYTVTGKGWRMIVGSASRDGTFALAWGLKGKDAPEGEVIQDGSMSVEPETDGVINYVVNLRTKGIVGTIEGQHFGDKPGYNHSTNETAWGNYPRLVAQVNSGKWETWSARIYEVKDATEPATLTAGVDLLAAAKKAVFEHLADSRQFKKFDRESFAITLHDPAILQRGSATVMSIEVGGVIPKKDDDDAAFEATVTFTIASDDNGGAPSLTWRSTEAQ